MEQKWSVLCQDQCGWHLLDNCQKRQKPSAARGILTSEQFHLCEQIASSWQGRSCQYCINVLSHTEMWSISPCVLRLSSFLLNDKGSFLFIFSVSFSLSIFPSLSFFLPFSLSFAVSLSHSLGFCYLLLPPFLLFIHFWAVAKSGRIQGAICASIHLSVHPSICLSVCTSIPLFQCFSEAGPGLSELCPGLP